MSDLPATEQQERFVLHHYGERTVIFDNKGELMSVGMSHQTAEHNARYLNALETELKTLRAKAELLDDLIAVLPSGVKRYWRTRLASLTQPAGEGG